jgi:hypothetical protein
VIATALLGVVAFAFSMGGHGAGNTVHTHRDAAPARIVTALPAEDPAVASTRATPSPAQADEMHASEPAVREGHHEHEAHGHRHAQPADVQSPVATHGDADADLHAHPHDPELGVAGPAPAPGPAHPHGHGASGDHEHAPGTQDVVVLAQGVDPGASGASGFDIPWPLVPARLLVAARLAAQPVAASDAWQFASRHDGPPERPPRA